MDIDANMVINRLANRIAELETQVAVLQAQLQQKEQDTYDEDAKKENPEA